MFSQNLFHLLTDRSKSVTALYAQSPPDTSIHSVATQLYPKNGLREPKQAEQESNSSEPSKLDKVLNKLHLKSSEESDQHDLHEEELQTVKERWREMLYPTAAQLDQIRSVGQWGETKPGDLFLSILGQALLPLEHDPLAGLVSPSLMASSGVVPLSIISVIPDIIQHHADLIVRAEKEIFLATNFWEASGAAQTIVDAMKELSRRVIDEKREKVVFKLMYDRGNPHQIIHPHQPVNADTYTGDRVKLPHPDEIPGIELEVQNYHVPPVGTFHAKYMVVDRQIAILNSNNIQDRVNVEMMLHIEGSIVEAFYDLALLSWSNAMNPRLPLLTRPPSYNSSLASDAFKFGNDHPIVRQKGDLDEHAMQTRERFKEHHEMAQGDAKWDIDNTSEAQRVDSQFTDKDQLTQHLNTGTKIQGTDSTPPNHHLFRPITLHSRHAPVPMALVNRPPHGRPGHGSTFIPQDQAWLAGFKFAKKSVFIQTPTFNAKPIVQAALETSERGIQVEIYMDLGFNDEGELLPFQGGTNEMVSTHLYSLPDSQKENLRIYWYTAKDQSRPLNAKDKSRNCHIKLMIVDEEIIIQGNGNQDTQSWFHSQEINVLIDSPLLAREIRESIDANQNTLFYGKVDPKDGVWRDESGHTLPGQKSPPKGPFKSLVGVKGAIQRVRGEGGF